MTSEFRVGDRIRLKPGRPHGGYLVGDTGTIISLLSPPAGQKLPLYRVRMNRTTAGLYATFQGEELEPLR
jgi:hypothetical protein